jgi:hypothetical protein
VLWFTAIRGHAIELAEIDDKLQRKNMGQRSARFGWISPRIALYILLIIIASIEL